MRTSIGECLKDYLNQESVTEIPEIVKDAYTIIKGKFNISITDNINNIIKIKKLTALEYTALEEIVNMFERDNTNIEIYFNLDLKEGERKLRKPLKIKNPKNITGDLITLYDKHSIKRVLIALTVLENIKS